jgi:hypothetical protein
LSGDWERMHDTLRGDVPYHPRESGWGWIAGPAAAECPAVRRAGARSKRDAWRSP